jgi:hypothetical protein
MLFKKGNPQQELVDINEMIREMMILLRNETRRHAISVRTEIAADIPKAMARMAAKLNLPPRHKVTA